MTASGRTRRPPAAARALLMGFAAFAAVAAFGQALAFGLFVARGAGGSLVEHAELGWLYVVVFHGVPLHLMPPEGAAVGPVTVTVSLLLPTVVAVGLLFESGRRAARDAGGRAGARVAVALVAGVAYAVPVFLLSLVVRVRVAVPLTTTLFGGPVEARADAIASLLLPSAIAAGAVGAGALSAVRRPDLRRARQAYAALAGGARMFALGMVLSFVGLLVNAAADPPAARAYLEAVSRLSRPATAVAIGHHLLALPNQSVLVLVPAMGGRDELRFGRVTQTIVSYRTTVEEIALTMPAEDGSTPAVSTAPLPRWYLLFLLVPLVSTFAGGMRAAEIARTTGEAVALGGAAGVVFAGLIAAASALATVWIRSTTEGGTSVLLGPDLVTGVLVALAWGVVAGAGGGWWMSRRR